MPTEAPLRGRVRRLLGVTAATAAVLLLLAAGLWAFAPELLLALALRVGRPWLARQGVEVRVGSIRAASPLVARLRGVEAAAVDGSWRARLEEATYAAPLGPLLDHALFGADAPAPGRLRLEGLALALPALGDLDLEELDLRVDLLAGAAGRLPATTASLRVRGLAGAGAPDLEVRLADLDAAASASTGALVTARGLGLAAARSPIATLARVSVELTPEVLRGEGVPRLELGPGVAWVPRIRDLHARLAGRSTAAASSSPPSTAPPRALGGDVEVLGFRVVLDEDDRTLEIRSARARVDAPPGVRPGFRIDAAIAALDGAGDLHLVAAPGSTRATGALSFRDLPLDGLPLSLEQDLALTGVLAGEVSLDLDLEDPTDLRESAGRIAIRDGGARRGTTPLVAGADLELALDDAGVAVRGVVASIHATGVAALTTAPLDLAGLARARFEGRGTAARGRATLDLTGEIGLAGGPRLSEANLAGAWTPDQVQVEVARIRALLAGPATGSVSVDASARVPRSRPTSLVTTVEVSTRALAISGSRLGDLRARVELSPERLSITPIELPAAGTPASVPLTVSVTSDRTRTRVEVAAAPFEFEVPQLGPASARGRGHLDLALPPTGPEVPLLERLAAVPAAASSAPGLELTWLVDELLLERRGGDRLRLEDALAGTLRTRPLRIEVEPTGLEALGAGIRFGGSVATTPGSTFTVDLADLDLARVLALVAPETLASVRARVARVSLGVDAALAGASARASVALTGPPRLALWRRAGDGIHRTSLAIQDQAWLFTRSARGMSLTGEHLRVDLPEEGPGPRRGRLRLDAFPIELSETRMPSRKTLVAARGEITADASLPLDAGPDLRGRATVSLRHSAPTTADPAGALVELELTPRALQVARAELHDTTGVARASFSGSLDADSDSTARLAIQDLPLTWFRPGEFAAPDTPRLDLEVDGALRPLPGRAEATVLERLRELEGSPAAIRRAGVELSVGRLAIRDARETLARAARPFRLALRRGVVTLDDLELLVGTHPLRARGTLALEEASEFDLDTDQVDLGELLAHLWPRFFRGARGTLDGELSVRGTYPEMETRGHLRLSTLDLKIPHLASRATGGLELAGGPGGLVLKGTGLAIDGTPIEVTGGLPLRSDGPPTFETRVRSKGLALRRGRSALRGIDLDLGFRTGFPIPRPVLQGKVVLGSGVLVLDDAGPLFLLHEAIRRAGEAAAPDAPAAPLPLDLDLAISTASPLILRSPLVDLSATARAEVRTRDGGQPTGSLEVEVTRGSIFLHRTEFKVTQARLRMRVLGDAFTSDLLVDGEATAAEHRIRLKVTGSIDEPAISLTSTPARSEQEIVSLLTTGRLPGAGNATSAVASGVRDFYLTSSLNRFLSSSFGISAVRIRRDEGVQRIDIDKQLGERTTVTFSRGTDSSNVLRIEYRLSGQSTVEAGQKRDLAGSRPFVGVKRRLRFR